MSNLCAIPILGDDEPPRFHPRHGIATIHPQPWTSPGSPQVTSGSTGRGWEVYSGWSGGGPGVPPGGPGGRRGPCPRFRGVRPRQPLRGCFAGGAGSYRDPALPAIILTVPRGRRTTAPDVEGDATRPPRRPAHVRPASPPVAGGLTPSRRPRGASRAIRSWRPLPPLDRPARHRVVHRPLRRLGAVVGTLDGVEDLVEAEGVPLRLGSVEIDLRRRQRLLPLPH